jgi:hypothetical protein
MFTIKVSKTWVICCAFNLLTIWFRLPESDRCVKHPQGGGASHLTLLILLLSPDGELTAAKSC